VATPTVRAVGTIGQNAGSGNPTAPGVPAGTTTDDVLVGVGVSADNVQMGFGGFHEWLGVNNGSLQRLTVAGRRAGASETAPRVTHTGGSSASCVLIAIAGVPSTIPIELVPAVIGAPSLNASSTTVTASGITPAGTSDLIFWVGLATAVGTLTSNAYSTVGGTNPTFTERVENNNFAGTNEVDFAIDTGPSTTGAATGTRTSTLSAAAMVNMAVMFSINDVGAPVGGAKYTQARMNVRN
jgi:hypothetical protein